MTRPREDANDNSAKLFARAVELMPGPEFIEILVAGDPGRNRIKTLDSGYTRVTTKEIRLPANWASLPKA